MLSGVSGSRGKGGGLLLSSCTKVKGLFLTTPCALLYLCQLDDEHIHVSYPGPFASNVAVPREGIGALLLVDRHRHRVDAMFAAKSSNTSRRKDAALPGTTKTSTSTSKSIDAKNEFTYVVFSAQMHANA